MLKIGNIELPDFPLLLAPMEDITDIAFRGICKEFGADLMFTEFVSSEGLIRNAIKSVKKLNIGNNERPIGIQIFGHDIDSVVKAAEIAEKSKPDLIDLNFGCPVRKVVSKGAGAALLLDIPKMIKMTEAVVRSSSLAVTVKTRIGWDEKTKFIVDIAERLQDIGIAAISIHGRTRAQVYTGKADWTLIGEVKNNPRMKIPVFGNGDVDSPEKAMEMRQKFNVDGLMIGRGSFGNPWLFSQIKQYFKTGSYEFHNDIAEKIKVCRKHLTLSTKLKGEKTGVLEMRKHYSGYFKGISNFKPSRIKLLQAITITEVENIFEEIANNYQS